MKFFRSITLLGPLLLVYCGLSAQANTYILNGAATQNTCNCYTLTNAVNTQSGSVWNANKINLNTPFNFVFNVFLGCKDIDGADGIVFTLQPISTSVGSTGGGLGFEGITPSVGVVLDTWQNANNNDPDYDHISINANGNLNHGADMAGPVQASTTNPNIEDCQWHTLRIIWDPVTKSFRTYFDGVFRLESTVDMISTIFNNDPMVYWGFSAGTGGSNNLQQFCTALNPDFSTGNASSQYCFGTPITFTNISQSFSSISTIYWDFGDGFTSTVSNPPPHTYAAPGSYIVKLVITALDGCRSDTLRRTVVVGDFPVADFDIYDTCMGLSPRVKDKSTVTVGTIAKWDWLVDGIPSGNTQQPQFTSLSTGPHAVQLVATSNYGCASTVTTKTFLIEARPTIDAQAADGCINIPVAFSARQMDNATTITGWNWVFDNGQFSTQQNPSLAYTAPGTYDVVVTAQGSNGCYSAPVTIPLFINEAIANAGNDTTAIQHVPFQLNGTGGIKYNWSPPTGLSDVAIANPLATLQDDITYTLSVETAEGCKDDDQVRITVFKGSAIYVPKGFTPDNNGRNDLLKPYYVGIRSLEFFTVYNRWGEPVFTTKDLSAGWNGVYKGVLQPTSTYVWVLKATDYVGKVYQLNGSSTIIR